MEQNPDNVKFEKIADGISVSRKRPASEAYMQVPQFEDDILNPNVMVPYQTKVGEMPRKVAIERRKRLYASQNMMELLDQEGLSGKDIKLCKASLPLHAFDNTDFETRQPSKWVDKIRKIPAVAASEDCQGGCQWKECSVVDFKEESDLFLVHWIDTGQTSWVPRILLHFKAEDPVTYVKRFIEAYKLRDQAESLLRFNLYVNNMPTESITTLGPEQEERIRQLTFNAREFAEKGLDFAKYIAGANAEFARVMNQIVLDDSLQNQKNNAQNYTVNIGIESIMKPSFLAPM